MLSQKIFYPLCFYIAVIMCMGEGKEGVAIKEKLHSIYPQEEFDYKVMK